ncbi:PHP domain-containing protein [Mixta hanseatica]|uniref:PHP domain-containing protein n=1 Tax=Mixta hanseatica TaxID=2872648 RepID=A0ABY4RCK5_9GAMM|nr:PHP domain-containing protein [Mixta hanseatica]
MLTATQPISTFPIYDLHSHTRASDGLLTPKELVLRAVEMRVGVLAITDHDSVAGLAAAREAINQHALPLHLIDGVEASTLWENHEIHIVGLGINPAHPLLVEFLAGQTECRLARARLMAERLEKAQIPGALEGALALAEGGAITRGHFARWLIAQGKASNMAQVFKNYLARGKTGYAPPQWCTIKQAVDAIHHSGGYAILAHPGRYGLSAKWLKRLIAHFADIGGDAMEVAQCQQPPNERSQLGRYAQEYQLAASQGSDFHQPCPWIELGKKLWLPGGVEAVWSRFPALMPSAER